MDSNTTSGADASTGSRIRYLRHPTLLLTRAGKLLQGDPWIEVAEFASYSCQIHALNLKPWQSPPCTEDEDDPTPRDRAAQTLLRRMLRAGLSRFDPDPLKALAGAKRRSSR